MALLNPGVHNLRLNCHHGTPCSMLRPGVERTLAPKSGQRHVNRIHAVAVEAWIVDGQHQYRCPRDRETIEKGCIRSTELLADRAKPRLG